jgi:nucleotide-binding universal stress UspA family protein
MKIHGQSDERLTPLVGAERIVVAVDGGAGSGAALRWVVEHVRMRPSQVAVVSVVDEDAPDHAGQADLSAAELVVKTITDNTRADGVVRRGDPVDELVAAAAELDADLLVIGTHAAPEHRLSSRATVPGRVAARAGCPVVIVPEHWAPSAGAVVVGNSIDSASEAAVDFARLTALREDRDLIITHVWELPTVGETEPTSGGSESIPDRQQAALDGVVRDISTRTPGLAVRGDLRRGAVTPALTAAAAGAALLVVGRRRRSAAAKLLLGSTSTSLVAGPPCAVAVVPAPPPGLRVPPEVVAEDL